MKIILTSFLLISSLCSSAQTFRVSGNVLSTSLYQPFAPIGGYSLAYERMLDPGHSRNVAQFSYKLNAILISDKRKSEIYRVNDQPFYDMDAFTYSGYSFVPEIKYYFTWDAPMGVYINIFGSYLDYLESYTDEKVGSNSDYDKKVSKLGRGIGAGIQFILFKSFCLDVVGGYHLQDVSTKIKRLNQTEFEVLPDESTDKIYINLNFGINF